MSTTALRLRLRTRWQIGLRYCGLTPTVRAVAWALATWMKPDGDSCRPAVEDVAAAAGTSRATAFRALAQLKKRGLIRIHGGGGRCRASTYEPLIPAELEVWIESVLGSGNGRTGETVSDQKPSHRMTQTVSPGPGNRLTRATLAYRAYRAGSEDEERAPLPPDVDAVASSGRPATAYQMLQDRRRSGAG